MRQWTQAVFHQIRVRFTPRAMLCFASGIVAGIHLFLWFEQFAISLGVSLSVTAGVAVAVALAVSSCFPEPNDSVPRFTPGPTPPRLFVFVHLGLATWTLAFPWLLASVWKLIVLMPLTAMTSVVFQLVGAIGLATVLLAFPLLAVSRLPYCFVDGDSSPGSNAVTTAFDQLRRRFVGHWLGVSVGFLLSVLCLAPLLRVAGAFWIVISASGILAVSVAIHRYRTGTASAMPPDVETDAADARHPSRQTTATVQVSGGRWKPRRWLRPTTAVVVFFCIGCLISGVARWIHQLVPTSTWLVFTEWAVVITGVTLGWAHSTRRPIGKKATTHNAPAFLFLATWPLVLLLAFPLFIDWSLATNSRMEATWLIVLSRGAMAATVILPFSFTWGTITSTSGRISYHPWAIAAGFVAMQGVLLPTLGLNAAFLMIAWLLALFAVVESLRVGWMPRRFAARFGVVTMIFLMAFGSFFHRNYSPILATKLLFDSSVVVARQNGVLDELLPFLDDGRCLEVREGRHGTMSVWRYGGAQLQLSESGIPAGIVSEDPRICPEYSAEILPAVMPLVLHDDPGRVLLLGVQSGTVVQTCLAFPIRQLTCVAEDATGYDLTVNRAGLTQPARDERLQWLTIDPILASGCFAGQFDVVIGNAGAAAVSHNAGYYTREYFARAARCLSPDGIFAKRFECLDYGAKPIRTIVATMRDVFKHTLAVETATGNLLLLGTNSERGVIRPQLVSRLQAPHVRKVLSHVGWDWSVVLDIPAYNQTDLDAICRAESSTLNPVNSTSNPAMTIDLPLEVMRWGNKESERRSMLAPHAARLLEWTCDATVAVDVKRRIADMTKQRKLQNDEPDRYWMYRKTVKEAIVQQPRSQLKLVSGTAPSQELCDEDQRRLDYFKALGEAAKHQHPTGETLARIAAFEAPYDPLISYFLHQEVAELWTRSEDRDYAAELMHRLHAIHFSVGTDRSVRCVSSALNFLVKHPQAVPDPKKRWDHLNALLQVMHRRWLARRSTTPQTPDVMLNDIELSIAAMESTFDAMDALTAEADLSPADWDHRHQVLETELIRPLRTYRSRLLPHFEKQQRKRVRANTQQTPG